MQIYEAQGGEIKEAVITTEINNEVIVEKSDTIPDIELTKFEKQILRNVLRRKRNSGITVGQILNKGNADTRTSAVRMEFVYELRNAGIVFTRIGKILSRHHTSAIYLYKTYLLKKGLKNVNN